MGPMELVIATFGIAWSFIHTGAGYNILEVHTAKKTGGKMRVHRANHKTSHKSPEKVRTN